MVYVAAITPFSQTGAVDYPQFIRLMEWIRECECDGVLVAGTTGEGPSLSAFERRDLIRSAMLHAGSLKIVLGISTNSLSEAKWLSRQAFEAGAEAILAMPPSFFKEAGQEGVVSWFLELMDSSEIPVMAYNFPQRLSVELTAETIQRLAQHPRFYGVKDSSGKEENLTAYKKSAPNSRLFVGDETLLLGALEQGWTGTMSGSANVLGKWLKSVCVDFLDNPESAERKFAFFQTALKALRMAPQPATHKAILSRVGILDESGLRLPLTAHPSNLAEEAWEACRILLG